MYKTPVAISSEKHARLRFVPAENYQFAARLTQTPLLAGEVVKAAEFYPVVFDLTNGMPIAVLGLTAERNLYLDEAYRWRVPMVPVCCSRYPFALVPVANEGEETQYIMVMDESAETLQEEKGKLLYNKNGDAGYRPSPLLKELKEQLGQIEEGLQRTQQLFAQLVQHQVLVAQQATFKNGEAEGRLDGFAVVDWEKVQNLDPELLAQWQQAGLMDVLQAHTESMKQFNLLSHWLNAA